MQIIPNTGYYTIEVNSPQFIKLKRKNGTKTKVAMIILLLASFTLCFADDIPTFSKLQSLTAIGTETTQSVAVNLDIATLLDIAPDDITRGIAKPVLLVSVGTDATTSTVSILNSANATEPTQGQTAEKSGLVTPTLEFKFIPSERYLHFLSISSTTSTVSVVRVD